MASRPCSTLPRQLLARRLQHFSASASSTAAAAAPVLKVARPRPLLPLMSAAAAPSPQALLVGGARHSTIWRSVQEGMQNRQAQKEDEQFQEEIQRLAKSEKCDLSFLKEAVDKAKNSYFSWVNKLPGLNSAPEVQTQERYKKILDALKEEELRNPDLIKAREKQRIAAQSGETVQEINAFLRMHEQTEMLRKWLRQRVLDKKALPRTRSEMEVLMRGDPKGLSPTATMRKLQKRAMQRKGRGML